MRTHIIAFTTVLAALSLVAVPLAAQTGSGLSPAAKAPETAAGPAPRTPDGKPSFSGVWDVPYTPDMSRGVGALPFTEWGEQNWKSYDPAKFDYTAHCLPMGWTRQMNAPMPLEIMQEPNRIAMLFEAWNTFKVVPIDGRDHPKNVDPTWMGNSVGHWEGDTLVIDTIGFNDKTRLDTELDAILGANLRHVVLLDDARGLNGLNGAPTVAQLKDRLAQQFPSRRIEVKFDILRIMP